METIAGMKAERPRSPRQRLPWACRSTVKVGRLPSAVVAPLKTSLTDFDSLHGLLGVLFKHHEVVLGFRKSSEEFIELPLCRRLFSPLGVLNDEHHHQRHARGRGFERGHPSSRKTEGDPDDQRTDEEHNRRDGDDRLRAVVVDAVEPSTPHAALLGAGSYPIAIPARGACLVFCHYDITHR